MEVVLLVLVLVLLVAGSVAGAVILRRRPGSADIEPGARPGGPSGAFRGPLDSTGPIESPVSASTPVLDRGTVEVPEELRAEIEEALAPVTREPDDDLIEAAVGEKEAPELAPRARFRDRLTKARGALAGYVASVLGRSKIDQQTWDDLEEALISADVGVGTTQALLADLRGQVQADQIREPGELLEALKADLKKRLSDADRSLRIESGNPNVWLFVGVNGVGKTTTIGKIGTREVGNGRKVIMAAGDTFRAAAAEQLEAWAGRAGADFVRGKEGGDPGAVIFDAVERAAARHVDLVLADTAGRLHTKTNLMEELRKIRRIADKPPGKVTEVLLVLDATTGQNGLAQAAQFKEAAELTGVVLTKLDGTAKGGIALAIQEEFGIPIKLVGLGEGTGDLVTFDPDEFVEALFAP